MLFSLDTRRLVEWRSKWLWLCLVVIWKFGFALAFLLDVVETKNVIDSDAITSVAAVVSFVLVLDMCVWWSCYGCRRSRIDVWVRKGVLFKFRAGQYGVYHCMG